MARTSEREQRYEKALRMARAESLMHAELLNGRTAMLGFVVGIAIEALTGHGILSQVSYGMFATN